MCSFNDESITEGNQYYDVYYFFRTQSLERGCVEGQPCDGWVAGMVAPGADSLPCHGKGCLYLTPHGCPSFLIPRLLSELPLSVHINQPRLKQSQPVKAQLEDVEEGKREDFGRGSLALVLISVSGRGNRRGVWTPRRLGRRSASEQIKVARLHSASVYIDFLPSS